MTFCLLLQDYCEKGRTYFELTTSYIESLHVPNNNYRPSFLQLEYRIARNFRGA